eukprot:12653221-Alexandrium_andersonii.AAC.1
MAALVLLTELPSAWNSDRACAIRLATAEFAPPASDRWEISTPTSLPANIDCRSSKVLTARAISAKKPTALRP